MAKIKQITSREILNSKGNPTLETTVVLQDGTTSTASVPTGTSTGSYEAVELHDHDESRFGGLGVLKAVSIVNTLIGPKLVGMEVTKQQEIDKAMIEMDGTQNKARLGANSILSVSIAVAKAAAKSSVMPLFLYLRQFLTTKNTPLTIPTPLFTIMEGGKHGQYLDFQEFLVVPATSKTFDESLQIGTQMYHALQNLLRMNNFSTLTAEEGGFCPQVQSNYDGLMLLTQAIDSTNYRVGFDMFVGLDAAANTFYHEQQYHIKDKQMGLNGKNLLDYYESLSKEFHIFYLEDAFSEEDWNSWQDGMSRLSTDMLLVGDDLIATNPYRLQMAIEKKAANAVVVKPNQIGTVIEALAVVEVARASGMKIIVSHRGAETNDTFIADFAVGVSADYTKFGPPAKGERVAKYNRLLQIDEHVKALK